MKKLFKVLLAVVMLFAFSTTVAATDDYYYSPAPAQCVGLPALLALIEQAEQRVEANYTEASWAVFAAALDAAKAVASPSSGGVGASGPPVTAFGSFAAASATFAHVPDDCEICQAHGALAAAKAGLVRVDGATAAPAPGPVVGESPQTGAADVGTFAFLLGALALAGMFVTRRRD